MKVILVQNNPEHKNISKNIQTLKEYLKDFFENAQIDLVLFSEMALTGYTFDSKEDIGPYTSYSDEGETFEFCSSISKKLKCYTFLGFPEKVRENKNLYNSLMITNRNGQLLKSYLKMIKIGVILVINSNI